MNSKRCNARTIKLFNTYCRNMPDRSTHLSFCRIRMDSVPDIWYLLCTAEPNRAYNASRRNPRTFLKRMQQYNFNRKLVLNSCPYSHNKY